MSQVSAGPCQLLPQPTREQCSGLGAGPRLVWPMVPTMLASFRGRNRKKAAVVLGGAVLVWRRRLQTWPYRVTGLLWAQHGFGRGSGNNTTSNNWQEHTRGPFQGHGRPALFLLHLGAGQTDLAGDGDSSSALLRELHDEHGLFTTVTSCVEVEKPYRRTPGRRGGSPLGTMAPASSADWLWCRARCTHLVECGQGAAHLFPAYLPACPLSLLPACSITSLHWIKELKKTYPMVQETLDS